jgi:uncharacterized protein YcbK (DUF882 family)
MTSSVTWAQVRKLAREAGAVFPDLVAAQWALESGWGEHVSGINNYFGLKGPGILCDTTEFLEGREVELKDSFMDFNSLQQCVQYLVDHWYKDFKHYKGVNHCPNRIEAARELVKQGYATDPKYAKKLIDLMVKHGRNKAKKRIEKSLFKIEAVWDTWLKKDMVNACELKPTERVDIQRGKVFVVTDYKEIPGNSHAQVTIPSAEGVWYIWEPHWYKEITNEKKDFESNIDWSNFKALVTENLSVGEVLQFDKNRVPSSHSADRFRILKAAAEFQKIRDAWGQPIGVTSFYRPEPINTQVGGVPNSRHSTGEAFDIYPINRSVEDFYEWIRVRWSGALGDGRTRGFVHLDIRENGCFVPGAGVRPCATWVY